jgi:hypothetical protein
VRASAPIFSPAHCLKRPNFLLTFMVATAITRLVRAVLRGGR